MSVDIKDVLRRIIHFFRAQIYKNIGNQFVMDLFETSKRYEKNFDAFLCIQKDYRHRKKSINKNLYLKLNKSDREMLLRFFLKRFYKVDTATLEEIEIIDEAFDKVRNLYKNRINRDFIEFDFRGKNIKYYVEEDYKMEDATPEGILMSYYDVTHAFFLTEYEMNGFNPKDGEMILDCGAARGDTMLMFRTLYPNSTICSFECTDENIQIIHKNIKLNNIENVIVKKAFLYSDSRQHIFNKNTNIVPENGGAGLSRVTLSIDDYVQENNLDNIGLIKFDIEGGEQEALKGAIETIKKQRPLLYIPIYHLNSDIYVIPEILEELDLPMSFNIKWTEKKVWGVDCVLFVRFDS